jgi:hypothetical protein
MGWYDDIRVEDGFPLPRTRPIPQARYRDAVQKLIQGTQTKSLSCTFDTYVIAADGRLLIKGMHCDHTAVGGSDPSLADGAEPCADRPGYSWVKDFVGTIDPGDDVFLFDVTGGRVVAVRNP